jgi:hypothetical protein
MLFILLASESGSSYINKQLTIINLTPLTLNGHVNLNGANESYRLDQILMVLNLR